MFNNLFLGWSSRFLGGVAVPLECWSMLVVYRLNVCKVLSNTRESSSRHTFRVCGYRVVSFLTLQRHTRTACVCTNTCGCTCLHCRLVRTTSIPSFHKQGLSPFDLDHPMYVRRDYSMYPHECLILMPSGCILYTWPGMAYNPLWQRHQCCWLFVHQLHVLAGFHLLEMRATDANGNKDVEPASFEWVVY